MNKVKLKFDKRILVLCGEDYGSEVYRKQIKGKVDCHDIFIVEFPKRISIISSHFISGFIYSMMLGENININELRENINIEGNIILIERFWEVVR